MQRPAVLASWARDKGLGTGLRVPGNVDLEPMIFMHRGLVTMNVGYAYGNARVVLPWPLRLVLTKVMGMRAMQWCCMEWGGRKAGEEIGFAACPYCQEEPAGCWWHLQNGGHFQIRQV